MNKKANVWILAIVGVVVLVSLGVMFLGPGMTGYQFLPKDIKPIQPTLTKQDVLNMLNKCFVFEMGRAEPQKYFGKDYASGDEMCSWKGQQTGKKLTCIQAGRIYATDQHVQTGYETWSCFRQDAVDQDHNGFALCCEAR